MDTTVPFHIIATTLHKRDFVIPPHDVAPVRFVILLEFGVELYIFADSHDNVFWGYSRICLISALIPFTVLEMEGAHAQ